MLKNKTILITGGGGFIGSNLCHYFIQNNSVICFDNFATGRKSNLDSLLNNPSFKLIEGDIRNYEDCLNASKGVDLVFHQAALGSVPRSIADPITTNGVNISGFLNMIQAAKENGVQRFIYASSSSVYGDLEELPKYEDKIGNPLSPYAVTKLVNEQYARVYHQLFGMEVIGLRYFNVFGQFQDPEGQYAAAIPRFIKAILKGETISIFGDGNQTRDFTYIKNVIHANECAATTTNKEAFGKVFNIAYGEQTTVNQLIQVLETEIRKQKSEIGKTKISNLPERKGDVKYSQASIELARKLIDYTPKYSFNKGIIEAIAWYLNDFEKRTQTL